MTKERRIDNTDWPEWMNRAWNEEAKAFGSLYPTQAGTGDGMISIGMRDGQRAVSWGDWIIKDSGGELHLYSDDIFRATHEEVYEKVYEEVQQPQLRQSVPKGTDEAVWLNIYCAAINKPDTLAEHALLWADKGLKEFRARFH
jgi:hypothetical protein